MRIRNVKPEFYRSDDIDALSWEHRFLFIALFTYVDDNGVGRDREVDICADLFAGDFSVDPTETLGRVRQGLLALVQGGLVVRYAVEGKPYLFITGWDRHQYVKNPNRVRYPRPDKALLHASVDAGETQSSDSVDDTPALRTVVGSKSLVVGIKDSRADALASEFDTWYSTYPKKVGRPAALTKYKTARKKTDADTLLAGARLMAAAYATDKTYCPNPATWLHQERWNDEQQQSHSEEKEWFQL